MRIHHNPKAHRWVLETARWATSGRSFLQAALRLVLCYLPWSERWRPARGHLTIVAIHPPADHPMRPR